MHACILAGIKREVVVVLENIRSAQNVGAIFRTADAAGVSKIFLVGITPAPLDRFMRPQKDVAKAALGAEQTMPWESVSDIVSTIDVLKKDGFKIISIEQSETSVDYKSVVPSEKTAFILGSEVDGVSGEALRLSDIVAEIPMQGMLARNRPADFLGKESLNVSVAAGIALFRILNI